MNFGDEYDSFSLGDDMDSAILMHREAHFGGNFELMLNYYEKGGKGVYQDFDLKKIENMAAEERAQNLNLASILLTASEAEKVAAARDAYKKLKEVYTAKNSKNRYPKLIADLILSEEENPEKEIQAIVAEKKAIVPFLLDLVRSEDFYDPLFPGYGKAPMLAVKCLGMIGSPLAIISLFESIGHGDFFDDDISLRALKEIGDPAKQFLLRVLKGTPINEDNEKAVIALLAFKNDPEIAKACLDMLLNLDLKKEASLATYLILGCDGLKGTPYEKQFSDFVTAPSFPKELKSDSNSILEGWKINSP